MRFDEELKKIVRPQRLGTTIYDILHQRLMSQEIKLGDRIAVDSLVREFGVSQTPIRDALSQLEAQGLVVKIHLVGYRAAPSLSEKEFNDLYELRLLLEPSGAAKAAANIDPEHMGIVQAQHDEIVEIVAQADRAAFNRVSALDAELHAKIAFASGNRFFYETVDRQRLHAHLYRLGYHGRWLHGVVAEHRSIVEAIARRDPDAAADAMRHHIEQSYKRYLDAIA